MTTAGNDNLALRVLHASLETATAETTKAVGGATLLHFCTAAVATPIAGVLAVIAKTLVGELLRRTSSVERKLDKMLAEPFQTAVTTIVAVLSVRPTSTAEYGECKRQLNCASDNLNKAYSYAGDEQHKALVRLYQSLVAALQDGGKPFVELYTADLQTLAASTRRQSESIETEAKSIVLENPEFFPWMTNRTFDGYEASQARDSFRVQRKQKLMKGAAELRNLANELDLFCVFVRRVSEVGLNQLQTPVST